MKILLIASTAFILGTSIGFISGSHWPGSKASVDWAQCHKDSIEREQCAKSANELMDKLIKLQEKK